MVAVDMYHGSFNGEYKIDNSADNAPSTKIIKKDIEAIDDSSIDQFLDIVEIKKYTNMLNGREQVSLIIEDEEDKNNPFANLLFSRKNYGSFKQRVLKTRERPEL